MLLKDKLIKDVAKYLNQPEDIVATVISHSYEKLNKATKEHDELEISGFGVIMLSQPKLKKRIAKFEKSIRTVEDRLQSCSEEEIEENIRKIESMKSQLEYYKSRLYE